jgi:uncharacterized protein (TIGR03435 family)
MTAIPAALLFAAFAGAAGAQEFEVVSIKPNKSLDSHSGTHSDQGRMTATNVSLRSLIVTAYDIRDYQLEGPDWLSSERFDIAAKFPEALPKDREAYNAAFHAMVRKMLDDRFKLAIHRDSKTFRIQELVAEKDGIKFKQVTDNDSHSQNSNNTHYVGSCVSMIAFAAFLSQMGDYPVLDKTGLQGCYDLKLDWGVEPDGPTLTDAMREQLGLKLETRRAPLEIVVVDHVEKVPTGN